MRGRCERRFGHGSQKWQGAQAKGELKKRLEEDKLGGHIVSIETVDKMPL